MTQYDFLWSLVDCSSNYNWTYSDNRVLGVGRRGKAKGVTFNPITAVANYHGLGIYPATKRGTERAAKALGLTQGLAHAVHSQSNRGHAQIVRGKMLQSIFGADE